MTYQEVIAIARDISQIVFWGVGATIAVLTYRRARKTLLQPLRTEIFKQQLDLLSDALKKISAKGELELRTEFGLKELEEANTCLLLDDFVEHFYEFRRPEEQRPYSLAKCPTSLVSEKFIRENMALVEEPVRPTRKEVAPIDPSVRGAIWLRRDHELMAIPVKFSEADNELRSLIESPLLPSQITKLFEEFQALLHESISAIQSELSICGKELPEKYPNRQVLSSVDTGWIHNRINKQLPKLRPKAEEITERIRAYFEIDDIMKG